MQPSNFFRCGAFPLAVVKSGLEAQWQNPTLLFPTKQTTNQKEGRRDRKLGDKTNTDTRHRHKHEHRHKASTNRDTANTDTANTDPNRKKMKAKAVLFMVLLAVQFAAQPYLNRHCSATKAITSSVVIATEVCSIACLGPLAHCTRELSPLTSPDPMLLLFFSPIASLGHKVCGGCTCDSLSTPTRMASLQNSPIAR